MGILRFTAALGLLFPLAVAGQSADSTFYLSNGPRFLTQFNDTLPNAFAGGLRNPQVYNIDLNKDNTDDLVVFDGSDKRILPFIRQGAADDLQYTYAPRYRTHFPANSQFEALKVRDYNGDGLRDLFYNTGGGLMVYRQQDSTALSFTKVKDELTATQLVYCPDTCQARVFTPNTDIPGIGDVDGDGDLDVLSFGGGSYLSYYQNLASERADLTRDSLVFEYSNACWGSFRESGVGSNVPNIGINCSDVRRAGKKHAGANLLISNIDGDADQDIIYGDVGFRNLVALENGKADNDYPIDTLVDAKPDYPASRPVDLKEFLAAFRPELSGDGVPDFLVTPQEEVNGRTKNQLWYYRNTGTAEDPSYEYQSNDFLQRTMVDLGAGTAPTFLDYNGDGVQDLLVSTNRNTQEGGSFLILFENKGTNANPVYKQQNRDFLGLKQENLIALRPAAGDLNGDGATDLVIGNSEGHLRYYENQSAPGEAVNFRLVSEQLDQLDVGQGASPAVGDVNNDGRMDLVVGSSFRDVYYFRQKSNSGTPSFELVTDSLGGINEARYSYLTPRLADLDQNGELDLLLGTRRAGLFLYPDFQADLGKQDFEQIDLAARPPGADEPVEQVGNFLYPAVQQQGPDSLPDIMVGSSRGGLTYLGSQERRDIIDDETGVVASTQPREGFRLYPNPAREHVTIALNKPGNQPASLTFRLHNLRGQLVRQSRQVNQQSTFRVPVSDLAPGVYISTLQESGGSVIGRKRVVIQPAN